MRQRHKVKGQVQPHCTAGAAALGEGSQQIKAMPASSLAYMPKQKAFTNETWLGHDTAQHAFMARACVLIVQGNQAKHMDMVTFQSASGPTGGSTGKVFAFWRQHPMQPCMLDKGRSCIMDKPLPDCWQEHGPQMHCRRSLVTPAAQTLCACMCKYVQQVCTCTSSTRPCHKYV